MTPSPEQELALLARARRLPQPGGANSANIIHQIISAAAAGDNVLVTAPGQRLAILELFFWNAATAQTLIFKDGSLTALFQLSNFPASSGYTLGYAANGTAHMIVSAGNPFILNLSAGGQVDGFIKYQPIT